jgi:hypothetical protein
LDTPFKKTETPEANRERHEKYSNKQHRFFPALAWEEDTVCWFCGKVKDARFLPSKKQRAAVADYESSSFALHIEIKNLDAPGMY